MDRAHIYPLSGFKPKLGERGELSGSFRMSAYVRHQGQRGHLHHPESACADHSESPAPVNRIVVGRLVMPASGAQALAVGLFDFLEKQGYKFKK